MEEVTTVGTVKEVQTSIEQGPVAFVAAVGWLVALLFVTLFLRQAMARVADAKAYALERKQGEEARAVSEKSNQEVLVKTLTTANHLAEVVDRQERDKGRRRRRPTTSPGRRPPTEGA
jgi:flagellar biosynthesis/type III secretory pathway M-ring protein FliF/YscJ